MNLPNKLTMLRIFMIPIFIYFLLYFNGENGRIFACIIFILAAATDALDGHIARSRNLVTNFGKLMDPLADKLLVCAAFVALVYLGDLSPIVVIIIISREFTITGFRTLAVESNIVIAASNLGKFKTIFQMVTIPYLILNFQNSNLIFIEHALVFITTALTILSAVDYIVKNKSLLKAK